MVSLSSLLSYALAQQTSRSPVLTLRTILLSLSSLLSDPVPDDPQDAEVARVYLNDKSEFDRMAKYWTECYAKPISADGVSTAMVQKFVDMGFDASV